jgi:hypothetical protein
VRILCGEQAHATIYTALRLLGLGARFSTTSFSTRYWCGCRAEMTPTGPRWPRSSGTRGAGWAAQLGMAGTYCGCRFRTARQQTTTSAAPPTP